ERGHMYRSAPLPPELRRVSLDAAQATYDPEQLAAAIGDLLVLPAEPDTSHIRPTVSLDRRLSILREMLANRGSFDFEDVFGAEVERAIDQLQGRLAEGVGGVVLREVAGGYTLASTPEAESAARRLLSKPRTPPLTQAQAETLAIVAYLQPVSRPEIARIRGVNAESAASTLLERGMIEEAGRSQFGAVLYRTTDLFLRLFGLHTLAGLPGVHAFDPSPGLEQELRDRLLRAGEARAGRL